MIRAIVIFACMMTVWLLFSGHFEGPLLISFGIASSAFVAWMCHRASTDDEEGLPLHMMAGLPRYIFWLYGQIIIANIATARLVLRNEAHPLIFRVPATPRTAAGITTYANSITLTPGTVTIAVSQDEFLVHSLSHEMAADLQSGDMGRRVAALERPPAS